jgi:hypothetical protein
MDCIPRLGAVRFISFDALGHAKGPAQSACHPSAPSQNPGRPLFHWQTGEDKEDWWLVLFPRQLALFESPFSGILASHEGTRRKVRCFFRHRCFSVDYLMDEAFTPG